jgi:phage/plasmid-like protein (TIGR03299 family)
MAHELYITNGTAKMFYNAKTGKTWHGLGTPLTDEMTEEEQQFHAGYDWEALAAQVTYQDQHGITRTMPDRVVIYRSDTGAPLSAMSRRYNIHQPKEVFALYKEICRMQGWKMETAGMLKGGAVFWAQAKMEQEGEVKPGDLHKLYILLSSSLDGSSASVGAFTNKRVVCNNTLTLAMNNLDGKPVRIAHNQAFNPERIKRELALVDVDKSWEDHMDTLKQLNGVKINEHEAREFFSELLRPSEQRPKARGNHNADSLDTLLSAPVSTGYTPVSMEPERAIRGLEDLLSSYRHAPGAAPGTAYGLVQGMTHWLDHVRGNDENRLHSAWFGQGAALKQKTVDAALALAQ